jgi:hypothetical protein
MKFIIITLILFAGMYFITSCKSTKQNSVALDTYRSPSFIVWNEDTVNSYAFEVKNENKFAYTILRKDSTQEFYNGICKYTFDTLFLIYNQNKKPAFVKDYLVREAAGMGYIQYFTDGRKKVFLFFRPPRGSHF